MQINIDETKEIMVQGKKAFLHCYRNELTFQMSDDNIVYEIHDEDHRIYAQGNDLQQVIERAETHTLVNIDDLTLV